MERKQRGKEFAVILAKVL